MDIVQKIFFTSSSKYCHKKLVYTSYSENEQSFVNDILDFIKEHSVDILIPILDETFTISKYAEAFREHTHLFLADYNTLMTAHDKVKISAIAESLDVAVPKTWKLTDLITSINSKSIDVSNLPFLNWLAKQLLKKIKNNLPKIL